MRRESVPDRSFQEVPTALTDRDRWLCEMLFQHRVFTTSQICDLAFDNLTTTRHRLSRLHNLRLVGRFRPNRSVGSAPLHYVLDDMGANVVASTRGVPLDQLGWRRDRSLAIATSQRLGHLVGLNGVFTSLVRAARHRPDSMLLDWWSEQRCAAEWGEVVRPDGFGRWAEGGIEVGFFVEFDRGTERLGRLAAKLAGYTELFSIAPGHVLLFVLPSPRREVEVRRVLRKARIAVATGVLAPGQGADGAVWQPLAQAVRRRLVELAPTATAHRRPPDQPRPVPSGQRATRRAQRGLAGG